MICVALGLGVLGIIALKRARRCHRGCSGCQSYGYGGPGGWGGYRGGFGGFGRRPWFIHAALSRLDATPAQERVIVGELDRLHERVRTAKGSLREGRGDLAAAVRGTTLDDAALGAVLGRLDGTTTEVRAAVIDALRNIHAVLDDRQREQLAQMLDGGWWRGRSGGGPYRV